MENQHHFPKYQHGSSSIKFAEQVAAEIPSIDAIALSISHTLLDQSSLGT